MSAHAGSARDRPHLLLFGWYRPGTGFTRVLQALLPILSTRFRITWMGVGYSGEPWILDDGVRLLPTNLCGGDMMGAHAARLAWDELAPDLVLALNDPWYLEHYPRELQAVAGSVPMFGYLPLDGDIIDSSVVTGLSGFRRLFTYTRHAAGELVRALAQAGLDIPVTVAGHGVERGTFSQRGDCRSVSGRMRLAQHVFGLPQPAWVLLNASRPDPRKRIDLSLEAFARAFREIPDDVYLCLHQAWAYPQFVEPLRDQARALGIERRVLWWPQQSGPVSDTQLNTLYNACAAGLNTSMGEGFGLVSFEHAATGAPQILPAHPALLELWKDSALTVAVQPARSAYSPLRLGEIDVHAVASAIERLYRDEEVYRQFARKGLSRCDGADLRWETSGQLLMDGLLSGVS